MGTDWDHLFGELALRARPLSDAGWQLTGTDRDESRTCGDSVFPGFEHDGMRIELEYYEHGGLAAHLPVNRHEDEETEPLLSMHQSTVESSRQAFVDIGWLPEGALADPERPQ